MESFGFLKLPLPLPHMKAIRKRVRNSFGGKLPSGLWRIVVAINIYCLPLVTSVAQSSFEPPTSTVRLRGRSAGGTLTLMMAPGGNYPYVQVTNEAGDDCSTILGLLAQQLAKSPACKQSYGNRPVLEVLQDGLVLSGGMRTGNSCSSWILGGTDQGFQIPEAPSAVSASFSSNVVTLKWTNPAQGYDAIAIVYGSDPWRVLPGNATSYVHDLSTGWPSRRPTISHPYVVVGYSQGVPSNGAGVHLWYHIQQNSPMNVPFTQGVAPNFRSWLTNSSSIELLKFEQGELPGMGPGRDVRSFSGNGFYQSLKGQGTFAGGVSRRFIGLTPGHAYRMSARMNTFEAESGNWAFTFHAAHNPSNGKELTALQMAGTEPLPDGTSGRDAGLIARYDRLSYTEGAWFTRSTANPAPGKLIGDIRLPEGVDSITLWFRLEGRELTNTVSVGLDSVTIEDLGETP